MEIETICRGEGDFVIWIPGWGGSAWSLLPLIEQFRWGTHILVNHPDSRETARIAKNFSIELLADRILDHLASSLSDTRKTTPPGYDSASSLAGEWYELNGQNLWRGSIANLLCRTGDSACRSQQLQDGFQVEEDYREPKNYLQNGRSFSKKIHLAGISMGGKIAQVIASKVENLGSLHLICTSTGLKGDSQAVSSEVQKIWFSAQKPTKDPIRKVVTPCFSKNFRDTVFFESYIEHLKKNLNPPSGREMKAQWQAIATFSSLEILGKISAPTWIYTGVDDEVVPASAAEKLHEIKGFQKQFDFSGGHMFFLEQSKEFISVFSKACFESL